MRQTPRPKLNPGLVKEAMTVLSADAARMSALMANRGAVAPKFVVRVHAGPKGSEDARSLVSEPLTGSICLLFSSKLLLFD
ncbi:hypothetical protein OKW41_009233 [Paraburkholderia sp. UCT70]